MEYPAFIFSKNDKEKVKMSSAVVVTGALRVTIQTLLTLYIRVLKFEEKKINFTTCV